MVVYIATVHKEPGSDYGVQFYDFPGCISVGKNIEEAKIMAEEGLRGHLQLMVADEDEIPQPSKLETILKDNDQDEAVAFLAIEIPDSVLIRKTKQSIAL